MKLNLHAENQLAVSLCRQYTIDTYYSDDHFTAATSAVGHNKGFAPRLLLACYDTVAGPHTTRNRRQKSSSVRSRRRRRREIRRRSLSPAEVATRMIVGKLLVVSLYRPSLLVMRRVCGGRQATDQSRVCMRLTVLTPRPAGWWPTRPVPSPVRVHLVMSSPVIRLHSHNGRSTFPRPATSL